MIRDLVTKTAGWRSLGVAAILLVMTSASSPAAREAARRRGGPRVVLASESARFRSGEWIRISHNGPSDVVDLELDGLLRDMGNRGVLVLDREAITRMLQDVLPAGAVLHDMRTAHLLGRVDRVRVHVEGMTVPLGRRAIRRVLEHLAGYETSLEEQPLSEFIDRLSGVELTAEGSPGLLDEPTLVALLGRGLGKAQRVERVRDPDAERRRALRLQYEGVVNAVRQVRRESAGVRDAEKRLYDGAYGLLTAANQIDAAPLLELHVELEQELERTQFASMTRAERIALRLETRRRIFGDEVTGLLFGRDEAMERYEIDRLALEANAELSEQDKASRLSERRAALRVELAAQGTYVSFPDDARARRTVHAAEPETAAEPTAAEPTAAEPTAAEPTADAGRERRRR